MQKLVIGESVPGITLADLDGRVHILSDYLGRIVLLDFWSAGCPHSERADQALVRFLPAWGERVAVLWVACNDTDPAGMLEAAARKRGLPLVLHDPGHIAADRFGVQVTPQIFVVDAAGILRYQGAFDDTSLGYPEPARCYAREAVEALLAGRYPDPAQTRPFGCTLVRLPV